MKTVTYKYNIFGPDKEFIKTIYAFASLKGRCKEELITVLKTAGVISKQRSHKNIDIDITYKRPWTLVIHTKREGRKPQLLLTIIEV